MDADPGRRISKFACIILLFAIVSCKQSVSDIKTKDTAQAHTDSLKAKTEINDFINPDTVGKRTIYLTFDDGPNNGTQTVIDILNAEQVPATFFLIGTHEKEMNAAKIVMPQLRDMPNVVLCNHSYTHAYRNHFDRFYADVPGCLNDFRRCRDSLHLTNNISRTPGNNIWRTPHFNQTTFTRYRPAVDNLRDSGFILLGWDAEWRFRSLKLIQTADQMANEISDMYTSTGNPNKVPNHCVLLMHDLTFEDAADSASLHQLIHRFKMDSLYRFDVVTNHPLVKP